MTMKDPQTDITLSVKTDIKFLPLVVSFAESSSRIFGLNEKDALKLGLASEEVFAYLCRMTREPGPVMLTVTNGYYYARLEFAFEGIDFDPRAFNLTANVSLDEEGMEEMGLVIAARSVDRMSIFRDAMKGTGFTLTKEKTYPESEPWESSGAPAPDGLSFGVPGVEDLKLLARSVVGRYDPFVYLEDFRYPGKVVDMVESGEFGAIAATDRKGRIAGGMFWRYAETSMIECYGPYVFVEEGREDVAERLVAGVISSVARSEAVFLMTRYATEDLPDSYFEELGAIDYTRDGKKRSWRFLFRQLKEDPGCKVYAHAGMEEFLKAEYRRHFLAREIVPVRHEGERQNPHSVFGAAFLHNQNLVMLTPLWDGADARENLARHIDVLRAEGIENILLSIDLGHGWQARLYPVIEASGFRAALLMPYRGRADVVFFTLGG
jgi:hypothetical protein